MNSFSENQFDMAVIGGGLAGLTAAICAAQGGRSVVILERAPQLGGRASTHQSEGFFFNQGPHALYRAGDGARILRELGISYHGSRASYQGSWVLRGNVVAPFPSSPDALLATAILGEDGKAEALRLLDEMSGWDTSKWNSISVRTWLDTHIQNADARLLFEGQIRLSTYCGNSESQSAGAALAQMLVGMKDGVDYLDEGWQSLVDSMRQAAAAAGAKIETHCSVKKLTCNHAGVMIALADGRTIVAHSAISTVGPSALAKLVNGGAVTELHAWAQNAAPVQAACLDLALCRLPNAAHQFAIGLDRPLYYSVHTRSARLAPPGGVLIQLARYLKESDTSRAADDEQELEGLMDQLQPGWREEVITRRFLPRMMVTNAVVTAKQSGTSGRPGPAVPGMPNFFVAGDWVGPHGMLADTSIASGQEAAALASRWLHSQRKDGIEDRALASA